MARRAISAYFFAIIIVEHQRRFLLIRESKHGRCWYTPAGSVEPGETLVDLLPIEAYVTEGGG